MPRLRRKHSSSFLSLKNIRLCLLALLFLVLACYLFTPTDIDIIIGKTPATPGPTPGPTATNYASQLSSKCLTFQNIPMNSIEMQQLTQCNNFGYVHIYKNGGTSIDYFISALLKLQLADCAPIDTRLRNIWRTYGQGDPIFHHPQTHISLVHLFGKKIDKMVNNAALYKEWKQHLRDMYLYTHVRDPFDRFVSGMFEIARVRRTACATSTNGSECADWIHSELKKMQRRMQSVVFGKSGEKQAGDTMWQVVFGHAEWLPQSLFLRDAKWDLHPFDFVGDFAEFRVSLDEIMTMSSDVLAKNLSWIDALLPHERNRQDKKYNRQGMLKKSDALMSAETKELMCDVYWMDMLCLPGVVREGCDLEALEKKYGEFIVRA